MTTIGHVRIESGDAFLLGTAYRNLENARAIGAASVSDAGMQRFRQILDDVRYLADSHADPAKRLGNSDVWGVAA